MVRNLCQFSDQCENSMFLGLGLLDEVETTWTFLWLPMHPQTLHTIFESISDSHIIQIHKLAFLGRTNLTVSVKVMRMDYNTTYKTVKINLDSIATVRQFARYQDC